MVIQIIVTVVAAVVASCLFSTGLRRRMDDRRISPAFELDRDFEIDPGQRWERVNRWESVPVLCGPDEDDDDDQYDIGGEG